MALLAPPATAPTEAIKRIPFEFPTNGLKLNVPDWAKVDDKDYILKCVNGSQEFSIELPQLPAHMPPFIPISIVKNGYIKDIRKKHATLNVTHDADVEVPSAKAREVCFEWTENGVTQTGVFVVIIHDSAIYFLRYNGNQEQAGLNNQLMDEAVKSIVWEDPR